jgi:hypothetical protein
MVRGLVLSLFLCRALLRVQGERAKAYAQSRNQPIRKSRNLLGHMVFLQSFIVWTGSWWLLPSRF